MIHHTVSGDRTLVLNCHQWQKELPKSLLKNISCAPAIYQVREAHWGDNIQRAMPFAGGHGRLVRVSLESETRLPLNPTQSLQHQLIEAGLRIDEAGKLSRPFVT